MHIPQVFHARWYREYYRASNQYIYDGENVNFRRLCRVNFTQNVYMYMCVCIYMYVYILVQ